VTAADGGDELARRLTAQIAELRYQVAVAKWQAENARAGRWWRLGRALARVRREPKRFWQLPADAFRIALSPVPMRPKPVRISSAAIRESLAAGGAPAGAGSPLPVTPAPLPEGPVVRPELTVATILDPFSALAFRYEWRQVAPGPERWREVVERERPALLFVESAWRGNDGQWAGQLSGEGAPSKALRELVRWCRDQGVPTVFWNKEDPPNYEVFLPTARLFDRVFTVDADCLPRYRADLGHDRVALLPFAAQPRIHNPVLSAEGRPYEVAFAGTYFADKHAERRAQMAAVVAPARDFDLHIYSRMQTEDLRYQYPLEYAPFIVGTLPYEQMVSAYKSYKVFLNVNSVTTSPTMCARRLFELSAAGTPVVSGPSAAIERYFGPDLIQVAQDERETRDLLRTLLDSGELRDRIGLRAHRTVLDAHTFSHRVDTVLAAVSRPASSAPPRISVVVPTNRPEMIDNVLANVARQVHPSLQLVLVLHGIDRDPAAVAAAAKGAGIEDVTALAAPASLSLGACMNLGVEASAGDYIAKMDDDNYYGAHYLSDLVRAFSYTDAGVVGKWAHYVWLEGERAVLLRFAAAEHRYNDKVQGGTLLIRADIARSVRFEDIPRAVDTTFLARCEARGIRVYSADRFNFVSIRRSDTGSHTWRITHNELLARNSQIAFYGEPFDHVSV
jgi:spore maturation protein CgeB